jgi:hypothetical protein
MWGCVSATVDWPPHGAPLPPQADHLRLAVIGGIHHAVGALVGGKIGAEAVRKQVLHNGYAAAAAGDGEEVVIEVVRVVQQGAAPQ